MYQCVGGRKSHSTGFRRAGDLTHKCAFFVFFLLFCFLFCLLLLPLTLLLDTTARSSRGFKRTRKRHFFVSCTAASCPMFFLRGLPQKGPNNGYRLPANGAAKKVLPHRDQPSRWSLGISGHRKALFESLRPFELSAWFFFCCFLFSQEGTSSEGKGKTAVVVEAVTVAVVECASSVTALRDSAASPVNVECLFGYPPPSASHHHSAKTRPFVHPGPPTAD